MYRFKELINYIIHPCHWEPAAAGWFIRVFCVMPWGVPVFSVISCVGVVDRGV